MILKILYFSWHDYTGITQQEKKKKRAGGFGEGFVLLDTTNPLPTEKGNDARDALSDNLSQQDMIVSSAYSQEELLKLGHQMEKWSDRREHEASSEVILRLTIPFIKDNWTANPSETVIDSDSHTVVRVKITGKRIGAKSQIELSVFAPKQFDIFKQSDR